MAKKGESRPPEETAAPKEEVGQSGNEWVPAGEVPEASTGEPGDSPGPDLRTEEVNLLRQQVEEAYFERDQLRDKLMRSAADLDNYRKRMSRERDEARRFGAQSLVESLLPVIDNLELGVRSAQEHHPEAKAVVDGFAMVLAQLKGVLEEHAVEAIDPMGEEFDPNVHECVAHMPSQEFGENRVMAVQRKGYRLNGRLIRAAAVVVSSGPLGDSGPRAEVSSGEE